MTGSKVLIVEDQAIVARDIERTLRKYGCVVTGIADSAEDALSIAASGRPDVILMDIVLKGSMDGIDATQIIRKTTDIPAIFLTAYSDRKTKARVKKIKHQGFLTKPYKEAELFAAIKSALAKKEGKNQQNETRESDIRQQVEYNEKRALNLLAEGNEASARMLLEENVEIGTSSCLSYDLLLSIYDLDQDYSKIIKTINNAVTYCTQKKTYRRLKKKIMGQKLLGDIAQLEEE